MQPTFYVTTNGDGFERTADGLVEWSLPERNEVTVATANTLVLRRAVALLEVLDERIFYAEPVEPADSSDEKTLRVRSARLVGETPWNPTTATRFALDCAEHALNGYGGATLPDGTTLKSVVATAREVLDRISNEGEGRLGYFARLSALRRLRRERGELAELSSSLIGEDAARDIEALEDSVYASIASVIDAVLAAIEALRHHVLPRSTSDPADSIGDESDAVEGEHEPRTPSVLVTPWGAAMIGAGGHIASFEPAWVSAREAARHARQAVLDRSDSEGETQEREWQGARLESLLGARQA